MYQQTIFPRWRGFNLLGMFCSQTSALNRGRAPGYYDEEDFKMIADFGFDFVRLPLSYRVWGSGNDIFFIDQQKLAQLDKAVEWGDKYGLHISICMHRLPGYCINEDEIERVNLWTDEEALEAAKAHWCAIAKRYKDINSAKLSFNVVNEVNYDVRLEQYMHVSKEIINAVRKISPQRLFVIDGVHDGDIPPVDQMLRLENCGFSCRGYAPRGVTHYRSHIKAYDNIAPVWPGAVQVEKDGEITEWDRKKIDKMFGMYAALADNFKVGVHCSEIGCFNYTPHDIALHWLEDVLNSLKSYNIGYALWNFRGVTGIMDSERGDVDYVKCGRHLLDRKMLKLLQKY